MVRQSVHTLTHTHALTHSRTVRCSFGRENILRVLLFVDKILIEEQQQSEKWHTKQRLTHLEGSQAPLLVTLNDSFGKQTGS
jgi:hypothetical protein